MLNSEVVPTPVPAPSLVPTVLIQENTTITNNMIVTPELKNKMMRSKDQYPDALRTLSGCATDVEVLQHELKNLAECVAIATEIYKDKAVPDHAFQLSALSAAFNNTYSLLVKQKDPKIMSEELAGLIKGMFLKIVHALALEIDKTKKDLIARYPDDRATVEDHMVRMLESVQPETQRVFEGYENAVKKILGIR